MIYTPNRSSTVIVCKCCMRDGLGLVKVMWCEPQDRVVLPAACMRRACAWHCLACILSACHVRCCLACILSVCTQRCLACDGRLGSLNLTSPQGKRIGHVPCIQGCLYKVVHVLDSANAVEHVSVMELHHRLGHIAVESAQRLVQSGAVVGVELDSDSQETDCDACIFACATRLPIPKVRISPPAQNFGDEIHTDVWGPATIATH